MNTSAGSPVPDAEYTIWTPSAPLHVFRSIDGFITTPFDSARYSFRRPVRCRLHSSFASSKPCGPNGKASSEELALSRWTELCRRRTAFRQAARASRLRLEHLLHIRNRCPASAARLERWQVLAVDDQADFVGIQRLPLEQSACQPVHDRLVVVQDVPRGAVRFVDEAANLGVDLPRRFLAEVAMLRDLAAEEDLLFLLAEGQRAEAAHAELADHLAGQIGGALDVVAGAGGHLLEEDLLGDAAAHQDGKLRLQVVLRHRVLVVFRQL